MTAYQMNYSARLTYEQDTWVVYDYCSNLADKYYPGTGLAFTNFGSLKHGAPREVGVGARLKF